MRILSQTNRTVDFAPGSRLIKRGTMVIAEMMSGQIITLGTYRNRSRADEVISDLVEHLSFDFPKNSNDNSYTMPAV